MEKKDYVQPKANVIGFAADDYCDLIPVSGPVEADARKKRVYDDWEEEEIESN